jgi:hypothetical protein
LLNVFTPTKNFVPSRRLEKRIRYLAAYILIVCIMETKAMDIRSRLESNHGALSASWIQDKLKDVANQDRWLVYKRLQKDIDALSM